MIEWPHKHKLLPIYFLPTLRAETSCAPTKNALCGDTRNFCSYSRQFRALVVILCYVTSALSTLGATGLMIDFCIYPRHVSNQWWRGNWNERGECGRREYVACSSSPFTNRKRLGSSTCKKQEWKINSKENGLNTPGLLILLFFIHCERSIEWLVWSIKVTLFYIFAAKLGFGNAISGP